MAEQTPLVGRPTQVAPRIEHRERQSRQSPARKGNKPSNSATEAHHGEGWNGVERRSGRDRRTHQSRRGRMLDSRGRQDRRSRNFSTRA